MTYFSQFPLTDYSFDKKDYVIITDFTKRVKIQNLTSNSAFVFDKYSIKDGERPEDVSFSFYNTTSLHWIILLSNEIIDPVEEWCLSYEQVTSRASEKYNNIYATHHWINSDGFIVNAPSSPDIAEAQGLYPISNLQFEVDTNEKNRSIKILRPELISQFVEEFNKIIKR